MTIVPMALLEISRSLVWLTALIAFDDLKRDLLDPLIAGETAFALRAFAPPANDVRLAALARVDHAVF